MPRRPLPPLHPGAARRPPTPTLPFTECVAAKQAVRTSIMETVVHDGFRVLEVDDPGATLRLLADVTK
jgi:hypothetical protein